MLAAAVRQGITVGERVPIPDHLIPDDAKVEMEAKIAAGYFSRGQYNTALDEVKQALILKPGMREAINLRGRGILIGRHAGQLDGQWQLVLRGSGHAAGAWAG